MLDFAPNPKEQKEGAALDPSLLPLIRDVDALIIVIPEFAGGRETPMVAAVESVESELIFTHFNQTERRLERLKKEKGNIDFERAGLEKRSDGSATARRCESRMTAQESQAFSSFGFLAQARAGHRQPRDGRAAADITDAEHVAAPAHGLEVFRLAAAFESELWELDESGQKEMLKDAGLEHPRATG